MWSTRIDLLSKFVGVNIEIVIVFDCLRNQTETIIILVQ